MRLNRDKNACRLLNVGVCLYLCAPAGPEEFRQCHSIHYAQQATKHNLCGGLRV